MLAAPVRAQAATAQGVPTGAAVTLSTPGLYDISTATSGATVTIAADGVALTGTHPDLTVVINGSITLSLKDAHISNTGNNNPVRAGGMNCGLILVGANSAVNTSVYVNSAGVNVPSTASLTIEGPGSLAAQGGAESAGIGGNRVQSSGAITIRHATVTAGGGGSGITLLNASVAATGGSHVYFPGGAGIGGGGIDGAGTNITVTASAVVALGGRGGTDNIGTGTGTGGGAGIGGGGALHRSRQ